MQSPRRAIRIVALALACALPFLAAGARAQTTAPLIRLAVGPVDAAAPVFYAVKAGIYAKYGLDVELVRLANGAAILSSIAGGSTQLGQGSVLAIVEAYARGLPFTVIGNLAEYDSAHPDYGMLVPVDSPIRTPKELEGKTFGAVGLQDQSSLANYAWLDAHGVDRSTIKFVEIPASASLAAMQQGRTDVATFYEPFFSAYMATGKVRDLGDPFAALGKRFSTAVLYATPQWVNGNRDIVARFSRATQESATYVAAHEREVVPVTASYTGVDSTLLANADHGGRGTAISPADLQPIIDAAAKFNMIPKAFPASDMICSCAPRR